jgi:hypothetical protein
MDRFAVVDEGVRYAPWRADMTVVLVVLLCWFGLAAVAGLVIGRVAAHGSEPSHSSWRRRSSLRTVTGSPGAVPQPRSAEASIRSEIDAS